MDEVIRFLVNYGYLIVLAWVFLNQLGVPIPSIPCLLAAGALAGEGQLNAVLLVTVAVLAALPPDLLWYEIGRRRGMGLLSALCRISLEPDSCVRRTEGIFARYGARSLLLSKFIPGVETVAPPLAGMFGMRPSRFLAYDFLGTALWSLTFLGLGYAFHEQIESIALFAERLGVWTLALLMVLLAIYLIWKAFRRRRFLQQLRIARITPDELKAKLDAGDPIEVVDLRHAVDFEARPYVIPGATHIAVEDLEERYDQIAKYREIVLYCT
jgi:membrane protein DedA with SNARE-associated domain